MAGGSVQRIRRTPSTPARPYPTDNITSVDASEIVRAIDAHTNELTAINANLTILSDLATTTLSFFRKWVPLGIAAASIAWPSAKHIIDALAQVSGLPK